MSLFKKNAWTLFIIILIVSTLVLAAVLYQKWSGIKQDYKLKQHHLLELVSTNTESQLANLERLMDILGEQLLQGGAYQNPVEARQLFDRLMAHNLDIVGFALVMPNGEHVVASSNLDITQIPNLLQSETSGPSFQRALGLDKMVLGRTYYLEPIKSWLVPIRKTLYDREGKPLIVLVAGLNVGGEDSFFGAKMHLSVEGDVSFVRSFDRYIQFISTAEFKPDYYLRPIAEKTFMESDQTLQAEYGLTLAEAASTEVIYDLNELEDRYGHKIITAVTSIPRYELWVTASTLKSSLYKAFRHSIVFDIAAYIIFNLLLFALVRTVNNAEQNRMAALFQQATHDQLTGLPNRYYLHSQLTHCFDREDCPPLALLYVDCDRFKEVNDSFGHETGDQLLQQLAIRLESALPRGTDIIRYGGDEFIVLVNEDDTVVIENQALMLIEELSKPYEIGNLSLSLGACIGIAQYPLHGNNLGDLLRAADIAMYEAKKVGNHLCFFNETLSSQFTERFQIQAELRQAVDRGELFMVYQPQVYTDGEVFGVEALVRWRNAKLGFVPPDRFIKVAESSGLMRDIGRFIAERAIRETKEFSERCGMLLNLSLNISVAQLMAKGFVEYVEAVLQQTDFPAEKLTLEITESLFIEDKTRVASVLERLKAQGIDISLDDFGTGYSSLSMLREFSIDELKIDKSFVESILYEDQAKQMAQNIIAIGKNYHMSVVAEGVEEEAQAQLLKTFGCDRFQGYFFAKPMSAESLRAYLCPDG